MGSHDLSTEEMYDLMPIDLYRQAKGGQRMRKAGLGLTIAGACVCGLGMFWYVMEGAFPEGGDGSFKKAGNVTMAIGVPVLAAGIPLFCVGKHRVKGAVSEYNMSHGYPPVSFNFGATRSGVGLSMNF